MPTYKICTSNRVISFNSIRSKIKVTRFNIILRLKEIAVNTGTDF